MHAHRLVALAFVVSGCAGESPPQADGSTGTSGGIVLTDGAAPTSGGGGPLLDFGGGGTGSGNAEAGPTAGCEKVDFLFVIDDSRSMETNQAELIASFPEFVAAIQTTLGEVDSYHVGVVSSDAYEWNGDGCQQIGALVTQTGGENSSDGVCTPFASASRFLTDADDLDDTFGCIAQVGSDGDNDERMAEAALTAISPELNGPGGCNEGFLRDDALLVLVLITDEDDPGSCLNGNNNCSGSPGDPDQWYQTVVDAKGGHPENAVVLSLTRGAPGNACDDPQMSEKDGERVMAFAQMFGATGLVGDICADSFGPFFADAVGQIESACGGFVPPAG